MGLIDKDILVAEIEKKLADILACRKDASIPEERIVLTNMLRLCEEILSFLGTIEVKKIPKWKKTIHDNGCWSCEIGVNPSKRLYEYEHYTTNADELFKLLDKEE